MTPVTLGFQLQRSYAGPLVKASVVANSAKFQEHLERGAPYPGQVVWVESEECAYRILSIGANGEYEKVEGVHVLTGTTSGSGPVTLGPAPALSGEVSILEASVVAKTDADEVGVWQIEALLKQTGALAIVGFPVVRTIGAEGDLASAEVRVAVGSGSPGVEVDAPAPNAEWKAYVEFRQV